MFKKTYEKIKSYLVLFTFDRTKGNYSDNATMSKEGVERTMLQFDDLTPAKQKRAVNFLKFSNKLILCIAVLIVFLIIIMYVI